mmetsp:Transcript_43334/g.99864  ORF Transcript_43334/g.99864 Transcript_43334/m.99864 type:complete len:174 (-) Transcript_43334:48-569(-)
MGQSCCCESRGGTPLTVVTANEIRETEESAEMPEPETVTLPTESTEHLQSQKPVMVNIPPEPAPMKSAGFQEVLTVQLPRRDGVPLGLCLGYSASTKAIEIREVRQDGLIAEWNRNNPDKQVYKGLFVHQVNGHKTYGIREDDLTACMDSDKVLLNIMLSSEPPEPHEWEDNA